MQSLTDSTALKNQLTKCPFPPNTMTDLLGTVLLPVRRQKMYHQIQGTAMGTKKYLFTNNLLPPRVSAPGVMALLSLYPAATTSEDVSLPLPKSDCQKLPEVNHAIKLPPSAVPK